MVYHMPGKVNPVISWMVLVETANFGRKENNVMAHKFDMILSSHFARKITMTLI